jgi:DNA-directed RNA polymerase subunit RPC12/RpoP
MNKPYTCHNCGTQFDALPNEEKEMIEHSILRNPSKVKVKCPGCYGAGYTQLSQSMYVLDITSDAKLI